MGGVASFCALRRTTANRERWTLAEPPQQRELQGTNNERKCFLNCFRKGRLGENAFSQLLKEIPYSAIMNLKQIKCTILKFCYNEI
jgi:hypothetical protein